MAWGQGPRNCQKKCMVSCDSVVQSQLLFMIEKIHTSCDCSMADYFDHEHYTNHSRDTR